MTDNYALDLVTQRELQQECAYWATIEKIDSPAAEQEAIYLGQKLRAYEAEEKATLKAYSDNLQIAYKRAVAPLIVMRERLTNLVMNYRTRMVEEQKQQLALLTEQAATAEEKAEAVYQQMILAEDKVNGIQQRTTNQYELSSWSAFVSWLAEQDAPPPAIAKEVSAVARQYHKATGNIPRGITVTQKTTAFIRR